MQVIDGRKISGNILEDIKKEVANLSFVPVFCDVLVGEDPSSLQYVEMKKRKAEFVGISFHKANFPSTITTEELIREIKILNNVQNMCGIIIQLPLPEHIDRQMVLDSIDSKLDVDCLGKINSEKFYSNYDAEKDIAYPTALACMTILDSFDFTKNSPAKLEERKIVVLGQGVLVGRPVTALLKYRGLSPFVVTSKTESKENVIKNADIVISGIGKGKYITGNMLKSGAIVIDAGTSESEGSIVGDVDTESLNNIAGFISPVPGGVGPVTVAMLLKNVLKVAKNLSHE
ncbi:bifunctional 5,10-methylenetetrahydrofolate dehydrogenase/5,10-methenyltetrahydrofolate cyclohydrolase [Candidatus Nomurabacteria bacterium]|nr:bifunctional 5,10-methylenetetrahydrofolate dehydrogenase/5,10-methenyltetrahydrofolate cyclohydrolase [Candidatus Nomurabacteria bacterium]